VGIESTFIGFENETPVIYRPGAITGEMIEDIGYKVWGMGTGHPSPGLLDKHYSPDTSLCLGLPDEVPPNSGLLAFGELPANSERFAKILNLSKNGDSIEAAANLYAALHKLDSFGLGRIFAMRLPETGLGNAINDRLSRAGE